MRYIEVELKYMLTEPDAVRAALSKRGTPAGRPVRQVDVYYTATHRDFLSDPVVSEWLRLREECDGAASLNYKKWHPVGSPEPTHCDEYETSVGDPEAMRRTLAALGYVSCVRVDKHRTQWRVDGETPVLAAIDTVTDLGTFAEFEFAGEAGSPQQALARLHRFVDGLGVPLGSRVRQGYPHLILGRAH